VPSAAANISQIPRTFRTAPPVSEAARNGGVSFPFERAAGVRELLYGFTTDERRVVGRIASSR